MRAPDIFDRFLQNPDQARRAVGHDLRGGRDRHGFDGVLPALGIKLKRGDRIDFVAPKLDAQRIGHMRREEVENSPAHGKLADALHLVGAGIPRRHEEFHQFPYRVLPAGFQCFDAGGQHGGRHRILKRGLGAGDHQPGVALPQASEDIQARVFIFGRNALHLMKG